MSGRRGSSPRRPQIQRQTESTSPRVIVWLQWTAIRSRRAADGQCRVSSQVPLFLWKHFDVGSGLSTMLNWLLQHVLPLAEQGEPAAAGDSRVYLTARTAGAALMAFVAAVLVGPLAIRFLKRRFRERIDSASDRLNELHATKQETPTMGGLFILAAIVCVTLLFGDWSSSCVQIALFVTLGFGGIGAVDDWIKLKGKKRGLSARQKLFAQLTLGAITGYWLYVTQRDLPSGTALVSPLGEGALALGWWFIPWSMLVMAATSNGVNLTDGLDGLAGGTVMLCAVAVAALTYIAGHHELAQYFHVPFQRGAGEFTIVLGAMVGAVLGFLWFNCHPAEVFMGDTGSLPLGALLAVGGLVARQELLLIIIGGVFVVEVLSVILQIGCYKLFGRRIIACSPLHNHFLFRGMHETKIVTRFWICGALLAILGVASLKFR
ncbi:MAG: phospho-N-acetylmuramoyl-pentapeptide-transferase [Planctomycetaceae bacterium]